MTVGISAMCLWGNATTAEAPPLPVVVLACDQMITSGDIEFEPPQPKIYPLTSSIVMLIAGDTGALSEIYNATRIDVQARLVRDNSWMWVQEAADMVSRQVVQQHKLTVSRVLLEPLGLTIETFMQQQAGMRPELYQQLTSGMEYLRPELDIIVAGVDLGGAHVYTIDRFGVLKCRDASGFATIGSGGRLAASQFMAAKHARTKGFAETQLLTYIAKRRAEAAPGVGAATDLGVVAGLGGLLAVQENHIRGLAAIFDQLEDAYAAVTAAAYDTVRQEYAPRFDQKAQEPPPPTADQPSSPVPPSASPAPDTAETDAESPESAARPHLTRPDTGAEHDGGGTGS